MTRHTPTAKAGHATREARKQSQTVTFTPSRKGRAGSTQLSSKPRKPKPQPAVTPGVWAVKQELAALKATGAHWLTAKQCARVFGCSNSEWLQIAQFNAVPELMIFESGVRRWSREELAIWAKGGCQFSSNPSPDMARRQKQFLRATFMPRDRQPSKSLTAEIERRHADRVAAFGAAR